MAGSNRTKKALAIALKELTNEMAFSKITVEDICERCEMNRTSFYYHFKDKYDLANWIFDTEFVKIVSNTVSEADLEDANSWDIYYRLAEHLFTNRSFYSSVFKVKGQNSLSDHFKELCQPVLASRLQNALRGRPIQKFHIDFFTEAALSAIERWISDKDCIPPDQFVALLKSCVELCGNISTNKD